MTWNRMRQLVAAMLVGLILAAATGYAGAAVVEAAGGKAKPKGAKPPKERTVDVVVTKRPTSLRTEDGYIVLDVPAGVTFELDHHKGNKVWVKAPSGSRYYFPVSDVKIVKGHKASVGAVTDSEFNTFAIRVMAAQVTATMQSFHTSADRRTEWQDRVLIQLSIRAGIEMPTFSLMMEWAAFSGYVN